MGKVSKIRQQLACLWTDDRGQSTTEYILILAAVVLVALKFKSTFSTKLQGVVDTLGTKIDQGMQDVQ